MNKIILTLCLTTFLTSCAVFGFHGSELAQISIGMSKSEVLHYLGTPSGISAHENTLTLHYQQDMGGWQWNYYFVRLVDGKVEAFGPESKEQRENNGSTE